MKEKLVLIKFFSVSLQKPFRFKNRWWKKVNFNKGVALDQSKENAIINLSGIVAIPKKDLNPLDIGEIVDEV